MCGHMIMKIITSLLMIHCMLSFLLKSEYLSIISYWYIYYIWPVKCWLYSYTSKNNLPTIFTLCIYRKWLLIMNKYYLFFLLFMYSYLLLMCSYLIYLCLPVLTNFMIACIYVIVGFKSFMSHVICYMYICADFK